MLRWFLASIHLIALGIGLGAVWVRGRASRRFWAGSLDDLHRVFAADTAWGVSALLWISTGLLRAFGGIEKGTNYYLHNHYFLMKMGLLVVVLVLEIWPMMTIIRWRLQVRRGETVNGRPGETIGRISFVQAVLVLMMVFAATAMARGYGTIVE
jgi:putative membrane protein